MLGNYLSSPFNSFLIVDSFSDLAAIPSANRTSGMHVRVADTDTIYVLESDLTSWNITRMSAILDGYEPSGSQRLLPVGGADGYTIGKASAGDFDSDWLNTSSLVVANSIPVSGNTDDLLYKTSNTDFSTGWDASPGDQVTAGAAKTILDGYVSNSTLDGYALRDLSNLNNVLANSSIVPDTDEAYNVGLSDLRFSEVHSSTLSGSIDDGILPVYGHDSFTSGISALSSTLVVEGTSHAAKLWYRGGDATTTEWPGVIGETVSITGSGGDPVPGLDTPFFDGTLGVSIPDSGKYFKGADGYSDADIGTDDFVFVAVVKSDASNASHIFKREGAVASNNKGWSFRRSSTTIFRFAMSDGANAVDRTISINNTSSPWYIIVVTCDRSESTAANCLRPYVNGIVGTTTNASVVGNTSTTQAMTIGAAGDGTLNGSLDAVLFGLWHAPNMFSGGAGNVTTMDQIATEISWKIMGVFPQYNNEVAYIAPVSRASNATILKDVSGDLVAHTVGSNWVRVGQKRLGGSIGIMPELAATNICLRGTALATDPPWTPTNIIVAQNQSNDIFGINSAERLATNTANGEHYISQSITFDSSRRYVFSGYAIAINKNWIYANLYDGYDGYDAYFDIANGIVGTTGANLVEYGIELVRTSDSMYRWWIAGKAPTTGEISVKLGVANADGIKSFQDGLSVLSSYHSVIMVENPATAAANMGPTTPIFSGAASVTRNSDVLYIPVTSASVPAATLPRTILATVEPDDLQNIFSARRVVNIANGADTAPLVTTNINTQRTYTTSGSDDVGSSQWSINSPVIDVKKYTIRITAEPDSVKFYIGGAQQGSTDTSATVWGATRIYYGTNASASAHGSSVISKFLIYNTIVAPGEQGTGSDI